VTDVGGLAEIVPHGKVGYVVKPNADDIADALVDFINHKQDNDFSTGIAAEKIKYTWDKMTATLIDVANKVNQ